MRNLFILLTLCFLGATGVAAQSIFSKSNLTAWCIVPFDNQHRTPEQRIDLLKKLGIKQYAYDWREKHLPEMVREWQYAQKKKIGITAVWLWIDGQTDQVDALGKNNEALFAHLKESGLHTEIWVGVNSNFFEGLNQAGKVSKGVDLVNYLYNRAKPLGCKIALYNHGDWFGDPINQVKILEASGIQDIGIVYNFHHAHDQLERYEQIIQRALPYLWMVNLNGMKKEGPKILPIGAGDRELEMMQVLQKSGYRGRIGILGHVEDADVEQILLQNLHGLQALLNQMGDSQAEKSYH